MRYRIFEWIDPRTNEGAWASTYDSLGYAGQAVADTRLLYLRDQPPRMWIDPHARKLAWRSDSHCRDIYEIRFKANNIQQRPLGYFAPSSGTFTIVLWATHKGSHWKPKNFCQLANARWQAIQSKSAGSREIQID